MSNNQKKNVAASVRDQLLVLSKQRGEDFQLTLTQFGLERFLYRLSQSQYKNQFILKGAMLFKLWDKNTYRPTRDVDFLGFGESSNEALSSTFREICTVPVENDGVEFFPDSVRVDVIRDLSEYGGVRIRLRGELAGAQIPIQADIGFGDAVTPEPLPLEYPTFLKLPAPLLRSYPRETVVAEKCQAIVSLGMANSRIKDYYDLWHLASVFTFDGRLLTDAIANTFSRRETIIPTETPLGLSSEFYLDSQKQLQWKAFLNKGKLGHAPEKLETACVLLNAFIIPVFKVLNDRSKPLPKWHPGSHWSHKPSEFSESR